MSDDNKKHLRNSTVEFLIFTGQSGENDIEARYEDEWEAHQRDHCEN